MPYYRILSKRLGKPGKIGQAWFRGEIEKLEELTDAQRLHLERLGKISQVRMPPLEVLPGWSDRVGPLAEAGITTVEDLLDADLRVLAPKVGKSISTLARWKAQATAFLNVPE